MNTSNLHPLTAVSLPIVVAPFGYLLGSLFVVHVVGSEAQAVWLTTVGLTSLTFLGYAVVFDDEANPSTS